MGRMRTIGWVLGLALLGQALAAEPVRITVQADKPGHKVAPTFYSFFFEEISRGGEGGLYGQMIQNGSFEENTVERMIRNQIWAWSLVERGGKGTLALNDDKPLHENNPTALKLTVTQGGGLVGTANDGFLRWDPKAKREVGPGPGAGIGVRAGAACRFAIQARCEEGFAGPLHVRLESRDGQLLADTAISGIGADWKRFEAELTPSKTTREARLVIGAATPGTVYLDMVMLFPKDTFKGRPWGFRRDIAEKLADMKPGVARFPGGCFTEGNNLAESDRWSWTVGPLEERKGHPSKWGYYSSGWMGFHEFLQFCEDIGAAPMYCINAGMSHSESAAMSAMKKGGWVQDAVDALDYANADTSNKWGALRAKMGHPAPFNMKYIEIGNENYGEDYMDRYPLFHNAVKKKYPNVIVIANDVNGFPEKPIPDMIDSHQYGGFYADRFRADRFAKYDRSGPKIFMGEYSFGFQGEAGLGNMWAAVADAAFVFMLERNADVVTMIAYAPLLANLNYRNWAPNAVYFDQLESYGTPSYYMQVLFGHNRPDVLLATQVEGSSQITKQPVKPGQSAPPTRRGVNSQPAYGVLASAGRVAATGELIIKLLNGCDQPAEVEISLQGVEAVAHEGKAWVLTSADPYAQNSIEEPIKITPKEEALTRVSTRFSRVLPAYSITLMRLKEEK